MPYHWKHWIFIVAALVVTGAVLVLAPGEAEAAVGGVFVKALKSSPWVRVLFGIAVVILLPLILYVLGREQWSIFQTKRDLRALAERYPYFDWAGIQTRAQAAFEAVYSKWPKNDLEPARAFMTQDYFQSQQDMLDRWRDEGKRNVVTLESKPKFAPLSLMIEDEAGLSTVWLRVTVNLVDYLEHEASRKRHKGRKSSQKGFESIWMFAYSEGAWRLAGVDEGSQSLNISLLKNRLDTGSLDRISAHVPAAAAAAAEPAAEDEEDSGEASRGG